MMAFSLALCDSSPHQEQNYLCLSSPLARRLSLLPLMIPKHGVWHIAGAQKMFGLRLFCSFNPAAQKWPKYFSMTHENGLRKLRLSRSLC